MKRSTVLNILMFSSVISFGQNISVTFTGTGAATGIDSVTATNLRTNQYVTLPGNETLILSFNTGIPDPTDLTDLGILFPNPFSGQATVRTFFQNPQKVFLKLQNLVGQVVAQTEAWVQPGENEFSLSLSMAGIYLVTLQSEQGITSFRAVCSQSTGTGNQIKYLGSSQNNNTLTVQPGLKTAQTTFTLGYTPGDVILYRCWSGIYTTIVTDSSTASKNYMVEFVPCTDPDGRSYSIVKIGEQTWMAENLAYLPAVNPPLAGSEDTPEYYVYDYEGFSILEAKASAHYSTYGVLYNWTAAVDGSDASSENPSGIQGICPNGWHLPSQSEWSVLNDYLGSTPGGKMKGTGTRYWLSPNEGATNTSGFTSLAAGLRSSSGVFQMLGEYAFFWSTTSNQTSSGWMRILNYGVDVVNWNNYFRSGGLSVRCIRGQGSPGLAKTTTAEITAITDTTANSGGMVLSNWGEEVTVRGICWNTQENPKVSDHKTTDGSGKGMYSSSLTGLSPGTVYYIRAYTTNKVGTAYGEQKQFKTTGLGSDFEYHGRVYRYKTIGTQTWMTENLAYLPSVSPSLAGSGENPFYYVYGYEGISVDDAKSTANYTDYGVLYNWPAAMTACPPGWHLPSEADWNLLTTYLSGDAVAGGKMKKTGTTFWNVPNTGGTNESGFSALGGGYRSGGNAIFDGGKQYGTFWSSASPNATIAWYWYLSYNSGAVTPRYPFSRSAGASVRCVRN